MTNHEAEEDNDEGEIIRESISEREQEWKGKWPKEEDKITYKRSQIFEKLNLPEAANSWGQFIFKGITSRRWVCITLFLYVINCSISVLFIQKSMQFECKYLNNILGSKNRLTGKYCSHCILPMVIRFIIVSHLIVSHLTEWFDKNSALPSCLLKPKDISITNETSALLISVYLGQWSNDDRIK